MPRRVLDVGQCMPDHAAIRRMLESLYRAEVVQTHGMDDTLAALRAGAFDLVLVNRKLDADYSDGLEIIHRIKAQRDLAGVPVMLVSNYHEYQEQALKAGAEYGFGKAELNRPETHERLARIFEETQKSEGGTQNVE